MFDLVKELKGYKVHGRDGEMGKIEEFYFDDHHWTVRYLVVATGGWLTGRQVLVSPYAVVDVNSTARTVTVNLTKKQIEHSPSFESDRPISRQFEESYYGYYGYPYYWGGLSIWGFYPYIQRDPKKWRAAARDGAKVDSNLRSTRDVTGHHIQATDGEIGHVGDFILDDATWAIRYLVVDTRNWLPGKKVLVSPEWIDRISWGESKVFLLVSRDMVSTAPKFTSSSLLTRSEETKLFRHYHRRGYWAGDFEDRDLPPGMGRRNFGEADPAAERRI